MKTKRGIYLDINESDIIFKDEDITYYFSSEFNKKRFLMTYQDFIKNETLKTDRKYGINSNFDILYAITLYKKIEKRGFKITYENEIINSEDKIYVYFQI